MAENSQEKDLLGEFEKVAKDAADKWVADNRETVDHWGISEQEVQMAQKRAINDYLCRWVNGTGKKTINEYAGGDNAGENLRKKYNSIDSVARNTDRTTADIEPNELKTINRAPFDFILPKDYRGEIDPSKDPRGGLDLSLTILRFLSYTAKKGKKEIKKYENGELSPLKKFICSDSKTDISGDTKLRILEGFFKFQKKVKKKLESPKPNLRKEETCETIVDIVLFQAIEAGYRFNLLLGICYFWDTLYVPADKNSEALPEGMSENERMLIYVRMLLAWLLYCVYSPNSVNYSTLWDELLAYGRFGWIMNFYTEFMAWTMETGGNLDNLVIEHDGQYLVEEHFGKIWEKYFATKGTVVERYQAMFALNGEIFKEIITAYPLDEAGPWESNRFEILQFFLDYNTVTPQEWYYNSWFDEKTRDERSELANRIFDVILIFSRKNNT